MHKNWFICNWPLHLCWDSHSNSDQDSDLSKYILIYMDEGLAAIGLVDLGEEYGQVVSGAQEMDEMLDFVMEVGVFF